MQLYFKINKTYQQVDIDKSDETISFNHTFESKENPTKYVSDYSYSLNIPKTSNNNKLLKFYNHLDTYSSGNVSYEYIYIDSNVVISKGTAILNNITKDNYVFTLNGGLSTIFKKLFNSGWNKTKKNSDDDYKMLLNNSNEVWELNESLVKKSFETDEFIFNFEDFEALDGEDKFVQIAGFIPTNNNDLSNFDKRKWIFNNNIYEFGKVGDSSSTDVEIEESEITESVVAEYRCYNLRPYIYVSRLLQLYQKEFKTITDYDLVLDSRWFNKNYGFLKGLCYVLPKIDTTNVETTNQYISNPFAQTFTPNYSTFLNLNTTFTSDKLITADNNNRAVFDWSLPLTFTCSSSMNNSSEVQMFNKHYILKITATVKNSNQTFTTKEYLYAPISSYYKSEWESYYEYLYDYLTTTYPNSEVIMYEYDVMKTNRNGKLTFNFGYLNGSLMIENVFDAYVELNLTAFQYSWTDIYTPIEFLNENGSSINLETEAIIDTTLTVNNGYKSKLTLDRLFSTTSPFEVIMKFAKLNGLFWLIDEFEQKITLIRKADYFNDILNRNILKNTSIYPYNNVYDITKYADFSSYTILPIGWDTKSITLNFAEGNTEYGKQYNEKYGITYGSKRINTANKVNDENKNLLCNSSNDTINPPIFSAEYRRSLYNLLNGINTKQQEHNYLNDDDNLFIYRIENGTYNSEIRNDYRTDENGSYVIISGDTDIEKESNIYCWHYLGNFPNDIKTYVRPIFSESNNIHTVLFAEPYEYYSTTYPSSKSNNYLYENHLADYFTEVYNPSNKVIELNITINSNLYQRLLYNPLVVIDNVMYILLEIKGWSNNKATKCVLRQITDIDNFTKKKIIILENKKDFVVPEEPSEPDEPEIDEMENEALILTNLADTQNTFTVNLPTDTNYYYKLNSTDDWQTTSGNNSFTVDRGNKLYLKDVHRTSTTTMITATANFKASGTLPNGNVKGAYYNMFLNNTYLVDASELKLTATQLGEYSYTSMFNGCFNLTSAPSILPATELANSCYDSMFKNCTSLTTAPELPATTLVDSCYHGMFNYCISLVNAPELPATTLVDSCYSFMFDNCTSLNYVKTNILKWNVNNTSFWLRGVASEGILETNCTDIPTNDSSGVPSGWLLKPIQD